MTERILPDRFVALFSDVLVHKLLKIYLPGNVILAGVEGSGKSMLLNLLRPEFRIAYWKANRVFPIPSPNDCFLGAGINLTRSNALGVAQALASLVRRKQLRFEDAPRLFGDFLNYWITEDIIISFTELLKDLPKEECDRLGILGQAGLDNFAHSLSGDDCWFGQIQSVNTLQELKAKLKKRINAYLRLLGGATTIKQLMEGSTTPGEPLSRTVEMLWRSNCLRQTTSVLIRVDQFERLVDFSDLETGLSLQYKGVINKFLSTRDSRVSYKVGARKYVYQGGLRVYGTGELIERYRDFEPIDLDESLRRKEDRTTWLFPKLAEDIFAKRLAIVGLKRVNLLKAFDTTPLPHEKARNLIRSRKRIIDIARVPVKNWPENWQQFLLRVAQADPLSAKLGVAWLQQKPQYLAQDPPLSLQLLNGEDHWAKPPWEMESAKWWKKERIQQALLQIGSSSGQRAMWVGKQDLLNLSGSNALVFVTLCKHIWDGWLFATPSAETAKDIKWPIPPKVQSLGIYQASKAWYDSILDKNRGNSRYRFLHVIGTRYYEKLRADRKMSYPGHNGFSIAEQELNTDEQIRGILYESVDYGDLISLDHTSKTKAKEKRIKFYLQPIFSPYFQIPPSHTKEPEYISKDEPRQWLLKAQYNIGDVREQSTSES